MVQQLTRAGNIRILTLQAGDASITSIHAWQHCLKGSGSGEVPFYKKHVRQLWVREELRGFSRSSETT